MNISVIDNDREQLNANRISGQLRMTPNSAAIRVLRDADGLALIERIGPYALTTKLPPHKARVDPGRVTDLSVELLNDVRAPTNCPRIEIVLDPVHFCNCETKPHSKALEPMLEFAHASEDPRETLNDR